MENNANESTLDQLNSKHRKERKELQSTIQSLKKSATKGDKKKRKEILEEISRLEIELEKKQTGQLNELQNEINDKNAQDKSAKNVLEDTDSSTPMVDNSNNHPRLSKAQKRRNKKAVEEKLREADILAHEEENKNGPRILENRAIEDILKKRNLSLHSIASDGDCLYNAIQHQLILTGNEFLTVAELRRKAANYILENKQNLICYMTDSATGDILTDEDFVKYCENLINNPAWGGQVEIKALSSALQVPIEVLQATGPPTIQGAEYNAPNIIITYHRFMYSLGEHYNSTRPLENNVEEEKGDES